STATWKFAGRSSLMPARIAGCAWNGFSGHPGRAGGVQGTEHGSPSGQSGVGRSAGLVAGWGGQEAKGGTCRGGPGGAHEDALERRDSEGPHVQTPAVCVRDRRIGCPRRDPERLIMSLRRDYRLVQCPCSSCPCSRVAIYIEVSAVSCRVGEHFVTDHQRSP